MLDIRSHILTGLMMVVLLMVILVGVSLTAYAGDLVVNIAVPTDPDGFDPTRSIAAATTEIAFNIYEGLVKVTPEGQITGALANRWQINDEQTEYTFFLREAYFHNGQKVTATDVVNALNRARDPMISQRASNYAAIADIYGEGEQVTIVLDEPYAPLLYELTELAAAIYPADAQHLANQPIGSGPYKLVEWRPNQHIKLERFEEHWRDQALYFDEVYFRIMPDINSAVVSLKTGDIDVIPRLDASYLHQIDNDQNLKVYAAPMNLVQILAVNNDHPVLSDIRVRQALAMAIDRDEIILGAAWGQGTKIFTGFSPAMPEFYNTDLTDTLPYDPERAKELLQEAGYSQLEFTMDLPAPYPLHIQTGEIIADQLRRIGVNVKMQIIEWGTWLERVYNNRDYELSVTGLSGKLDPHMILKRYVSSESRNFTSFYNLEFDQLISEGLVAPADSRSEIYQRAQKIITEEVAGIFIMDPQQLTVTKQDIKGWQDYPVYVTDVSVLYR